MYSPTSAKNPPDDPTSPPFLTDQLLYPDFAEDHRMIQRSRSSTSTSPTELWNEPSPLTDLSLSPSISLDPVKLEPCSRPTSPHFIIEPFLSSLVVHKSTSVRVFPHRRSHSPVTQSELAEQLLISQSLAPPTQVPLRATHASTEMLEMMGSFRLNPFAFHTKHKGPQREDLYLTWCGEEPKPLEEEPCMFEWQLEGYCGGILEDLNLIVMDDASSTASDSDSYSFHDSSQQLPFPSAMSNTSTSISSPSAYHGALFTPPTFSPGRQHNQGTPELPVELSEAQCNPNDFANEISAHDSARPRFRLPPTSFPGFPSVSWNQSQSDSFYSPSTSSSNSSSQGFYYLRSGPSECQARPHNYISRPYPGATERGRSRSYPGIDDSAQQPEIARHRGPIQYMLNRPGCGVNTSRSVMASSLLPPACSDKMESRNGAASQKAHFPMFSLSKVPASYHHRYHNRPGVLDNHSPSSVAIGAGTIGLPSLPACLSNGSPPKCPSPSSPLTSWKITSPESNDVLNGPPTLQHRSVVFSDGPIQCSQYSTAFSYGQSNSYPAHFGNMDPSVRRGQVLPRAMLSRQSSSPITTIPTAVELYASRQSFDALSSSRSDLEISGEQNIARSSRTCCTDLLPGTSVQPRHDSNDCGAGTRANCNEGYAYGVSNYGLTSRDTQTFPHHGTGFYA
ncbi:hypothetical protein E1B28_006117 [Marasmius oreades]|uniref:Uncharacterized protein n=1 Tax=Marasmius oreades TaxID=181124 RepID=A0A9P7UV99_9AGAR|nr:uncharacterized protein E1B28_006117 [Marasmius oreades]KAG7095358.1 hypothetical protein E1B28_006117 [Marasmius oreades]